MKLLLIYILQCNLLLVFIALGYRLLLQGLTFYKINRWYFIIGALYAFLFPLIQFDTWVPQYLEIPTLELSTAVLDYPIVVTNAGFSLASALLIFIGLGAALFLIRFVIQAISLYKIHRASKLAFWRDYKYREVLFSIYPFSFFKNIYLNRKQHNVKELEDIFEHETVHIKELHSIDTLFFEVILILCWYNPFVWLMRKAARDNLEYLTDHQVLESGADRQSYQYSLLSTARQGQSVGISNHFNFKTLKKRINMMNKKRSTKLEIGKYFVMLPILIFVSAGFAAKKAEKNIIDVVDYTRNTNLIQNVSVVQSDSIDQVRVVQSDSIDKVRVIQNDAVDQVRVVQNDSIDPVRTVQSDSVVQVRKISYSDIDFDKKYIFKVDGQEVSAEVFKQKSQGDIKGGILFMENNQDRILELKKPGEYEGVLVIRTKDPSLPPLVVIDGEVMDEGFDMNSINPNDIQSIQVWKDSEKTKKYGERAENGVVEITMKK